MADSLRVGIFNANTLYETAGSYTTNGSVLKLYERWEPYFERTDIYSPVVQDQASGQFEVSSKLNVYPLRKWRNPWTLRTVELPLLLRSVWKAFEAHDGEWDFVLVPTTNVFGQVVYAVAKRFSVPLVLYLRGNVTNEVLSGHEGIRRLIARAWTKYLNRAVEYMITGSAIVTAGETLKTTHAERAGTIESIVPSLVEDDDIRDRSTVDRFGTEDELSVLYLGRLVDYKRVQDVFDALNTLQEFKHSISMEVVGDGPYRESLEQMAVRLGISDSVTFRGSVPHDEVYDAYDRNDVFVLPSSTEGSPKTIPEALARGLPVVATNVGNIPELIEEYDCGVTYEPGDVRALASAIGELTTNRELLRRWSINALTRATSLTVRAQAETIESVARAEYPDRF